MTKLIEMHELRSKRLITTTFAEFLGTAFLVLVGGGSCMDPENLNQLRISLCWGLAVACIAYTLGNVSGAHLNPAVTLGFFATRRITLPRTSLYIVAQCAGALLAAGFLKGFETKFIKEGNLCTPGIGEGYSAAQGFFAELIVTFVLVFVIFAVTDSRRKDVGNAAGLLIGLTITICHLFAIPISGSSMNPARAFGPAVLSGTLANHWLYWLGPILGGVLAAFLYEFCFAVNASPAKIKGFIKPDYEPDQ